MGRPRGSVQMKMCLISIHTLPLVAISHPQTKFQLDWMSFKNRYGSPPRIPPDENFWNFTFNSFIRNHYQPLYQISAFYDNFEILVRNTPPTLMTPTGPKLFWSNPSSNSVVALPRYMSVPNLVQIGQLVRELSKDRRTDRRTDGRTWRLHKPWFGLKMK